jgi:hypothetical protein
MELNSEFFEGLKMSRQTKHLELSWSTERIKINNIEILNKQY